MKVAALQVDIAWHDPAANHARARQLAQQATAAGAQLIVLPEMFATGFSMDTAMTAEPLAGPTPTFLRQLARDLEVTVVGGLALARDRGRGRPQNVALAVGPDGRDLACYAKVHQFSPLHEDRHYSPGARPPAAFAVGGFTAACAICYDLRFPELFRAVAGDCGLLLVIASWPAARQRHWELLLPARAVENQAYVVGVNRVGTGGGHGYAGGSAVIDPLGNTVASAGDTQRVLLADIEPECVANARQAFPALRDRRLRITHRPAPARRQAGPA